MARVAIYLRVSTKDQTTDNQRLELTAWAAKAGHDVVEVFEDHAVSGATAGAKRPAFSAMMRAATRRQFDVLAVWSIDRLGRSLADLTTQTEMLHALRRDLYVHKQAIDTTTPAGKALFGMCGVFAEFEREIIRERINAGLARARAKGTKSGLPIGRAPLSDAKAEAVRTALAQPGATMRSVAKLIGVSLGKVAGISKQAAAAE
jgi:DNA invertase Pin-like site-specific DNA recombinase